MIIKEIETTRLLIRRPIAEDIISLTYLWLNTKVREFLGGTVSEEFIEQKLDAIQNHWDLYNFGLATVIEKSSDQITGLCGLHHSEDGVEISYMFFPQFWGKGYAYEAVTASINYGFKTLQMESIIAITQAANTKSCQLLKKINMKYMDSFVRFNALQSLYKIMCNQWNV
jgi:ribosomal-protein-alanine N-acetyltransferase